MRKMNIHIMNTSQIHLQTDKIGRKIMLFKHKQGENDYLKEFLLYNSNNTRPLKHT